jgi:hypothetical protein
VLQLVLMMSNIFVEIRIINQTQAATAYPSGPLEYTSVCSRVRVFQYLVSMDFFVNNNRERYTLLEKKIPILEQTVGFWLSIVSPR